MNLLLLSSICHKIFDNLPVHQRLPAEEVYFQVSSAAGIGDQEIQCFLSDLKRHKRPSSVVFSLFGETVLASQVAVMRDVEAERLHYCLSFHYVLDAGFVRIRCKKLSGLGKLGKIVKNRVNFLRLICIFKLCFYCFSRFGRLYCAGRLLRMDRV